MKSTFWAFLFALLSFSSFALATGLQFMSANAANFTSIPAPPPDGSAAASADLTQVLDLQHQRTAEQCARGRREHSLDFAAVFGAPLGSLTVDEVRAGQQLYFQIKYETDHFVGGIKTHWKRKRPYLETHLITPCLPLEESYSYPSGHAAISREEALVFGLIYPEKAEALIRRANEVALDRVIGGVHHPLDIEAGQALADLLFQKMQQNSKFQATVRTLRDHRLVH